MCGHVCNVMANTKEDILKEGFMVKRSQNKKVYTLVNYKRRWFVLSRRHLIYYDMENEAKRKERGRVQLDSVYSVEITFLEQLEDSGGGLPQGALYPFQVGYQEAEDEYVLYLLAQKDIERNEWISALRKACANNRNLRTKYHQGVWNGKKWSCCKNNVRNSLGCELCTFWPPLGDDKDSDKENNRNGSKRDYNELVRKPLLPTADCF